MAVSEDQQQRASLADRLAGDIETVGVRPVPEEQRTMSAWRLFIVWLMASASATTPLIGALLLPTGSGT